MAIRDKFAKLKQDAEQADKAAAFYRATAMLDAKLSPFADNLPAALDEMVARAGTGRAPGWRLHRRTECIIRLNNVDPQELTPAALQNIPAYLKLRAVCAQPDIDAALNVYIDQDKNVTTAVFALDPEAPFSAGKITIYLGWQKDRTFEVPSGAEILAPRPRPATVTSASAPDPAPVEAMPAPSVATDASISVKRPLTLKK